MLFDRAKQQCKIEGDMLFELNLIVNGGNGNLLNAKLVDSLVITVVEMGCVVVRWRSWWTGSKFVDICCISEGRWIIESAEGARGEGGAVTRTSEDSLRASSEALDVSMFWWFKDGWSISINVWSSFFFLFVVGDDLSLSFDDKPRRIDVTMEVRLGSFEVLPLFLPIIRSSDNEVIQLNYFDKIGVLLKQTLSMK